MPFQFERLAIPDVVLIRPQVFCDQRGFFLETYKKAAFADYGIVGDFVQDNYSHSLRGVLRGLHFQRPPATQGKLVMVLRGEVFDVAVDIRHGSPTFRQWVGVSLSDRGFHSVYIPPGFAHGFCVVSEEADFVYKVTADYTPEHDRGIIWNDPTIGVEWPIQQPLLSAKDARWPLLKDAAVEFTYGEVCQGAA